MKTREQRRARRARKKLADATKAKQQQYEARRAKAGLPVARATAKPNGHGQPLRKLFTLTPAIDKALTRRSAARNIPEAWIVRNALREVLGVDEAKES